MYFKVRLIRKSGILIMGDVRQKARG